MVSLIVPEVKKPCTSLHIASPIVIQLDWKKQAENPSGPGALSGWIEKRASRISWKDGTVIRDWFISVVIQGEMASVTIATVSSLDEGSEEDLKSLS